MAITEQQEAQVSASLSKTKQDKVIPFLIHIEDGRLIPNTPLLRQHEKYRPYLGKVTDDLPTRMEFLRTGGRRRVVDSSGSTDEFDVGKADAEQLVSFAMEEYGAMLDVTQPIRKLRLEVMNLAQKIDDAPPATAVAPVAPKGLKASMEDIAG